MSLNLVQMDPSQILIPLVHQFLKQEFGISDSKLEFQQTRKDFEGDITLVLFPLLKETKLNPAVLGGKIGDYLVEHSIVARHYNVVSGFLNIVFEDVYFLNLFSEMHEIKQFGIAKTQSDTAIMVEYSSPNTNKPLHLGHIRNNLLGYSVAEILKAAGKQVIKTQIINDRGIHICKSMLAWQKLGEGTSPSSTQTKGDKFVGNYYVAFDKLYREEVKQLIIQGSTEEEAKKKSTLLLEAQEMLRKWEAGDPKVVHLWKTMNQWVYDGFKQTYRALGVDFDCYYYESDTYLLGKEVVQFGLEKGIFEKEPDGSVWIDLTEEGLDRKIVLRADGTAVYMTQDIGTAIQRVKDYPQVGGMVYTVGNEQDYHFKVLFLILKKLGFEWADHLYHLSYGMVELPSGRMKSREGTVVDADDLMEEMTQTAGKISEELGKLEGYSEEEKQRLYHTIGLGALKYYMLKVDPKKTMMFNPEESVDFNGNTGPFIQYTYARIQSILRKAGGVDQADIQKMTLEPKEKELIKLLAQFPEVIQSAANSYSPALIANYTYDLVKEYNSFYQSISILGETDMEKRNFRVHLSAKTGEVIANAFKLLGIEVPERM